MGQINSGGQEQQRAQMAVRRDEQKKVISNPELVMMLLGVKHTDVVYATGYRGTDDEIMSMMTRSEEFCSSFMNSVNRASRELGVVFFDAALLNTQPLQELRNIIQTIARKDPTLLGQMPQLQELLARIVKAIELSILVVPERLERIADDIRAQEARQGSVYG
jgi:hypothetical protein